LNDAVHGAQWRSVGNAGERAFQLKDAPTVGPLAAVVRALHGLLAVPQKAPPAPIAERPAASMQGVTADLATMGF
jgi:hypothetical protein